MNNEDKILELLAESLQKLDQQGETLNKHGEILETHGTQIQKLVNVQVTQFGKTGVGTGKIHR